MKLDYFIIFPIIKKELQYLIEATAISQNYRLHFIFMDADLIKKRPRSPPIERENEYADHDSKRRIDSDNSTRESPISIDKHSVDRNNLEKIAASFRTILEVALFLFICLFIQRYFVYLMH